MRGASGDDLESVVDALYGVPLPAFIAERTARVKAARAAGDRDLAARIAALPKPSGSAWLVNLLARQDEQLLQRVLDLGAALREAQDGADRERMRALSTERRDLLAEATRATAERAKQVGGSASASTLEDLQQTLQAALVSEPAAAAVRTGRLVRALHADGLDPVDLTDALAGGEAKTAAPASRPRAVERTTGGGSARHDREGVERRAAEREAAEAADAERRAAEQRAEDAERRARTSAREAEDATEQARAAEALVQQRSEAAAALRAQLEDLQARSAAAERDLSDAQQSSAVAHASATDAARAADDARVEAEAAAARLGRSTDARH